MLVLRWLAMVPPSLRRRREDSEPRTDGLGTSTSRLLLVLRLPSVLVPSTPDRRGGSGSEERRRFRLLLTPVCEGMAAGGERAAIALLPKSEKDMILLSFG